ncbi:MAG: T9SS type A sorting domain-containing protein, partial [Bacteroidota bacterium]
PFYCAGDMLVLSSSNTEGNQWVLDGDLIDGATLSEYEATMPGTYTLVYTDANGCSNTSQNLPVIEAALPDEPVFTNGQNLLLIEDIDIADEFTLQWYLDDQIIEGAVFPEYCATSSGNYTLEVMDQNTGCTNTYSLDVEYDPSVSCLVNTIEHSWDIDLQLSPNPTAGFVRIQLNTQEAGLLQLKVMDMRGQLMIRQSLSVHSGSNETSIDLSDFPAGMYLLQLQDGQNQRTEKLFKQ